MIFKNQEQIIKNGQTPGIKNARRDILEILDSAIKTVNPYDLVKSKFHDKKIIINTEKIDINDFENIYLISFGKASVGMAQAVCDSVKIKKGAIITNELARKVKDDNVTTLIGTHPIPTQENINQTSKLINIAKNCKKKDLLLVLISGGGSSLLCKPRVNITDMGFVTDLLLKSGANIMEINTIRKHLSHVKGGLLASITKCTTVSLIISDVINDPIGFIASGPTFPDSTTYRDAQEILKKYDLWIKIPDPAKKVISDGIKGLIPETPKKDDSVFKKVFNFVIGNNDILCKAVQKKAKKMGYKTVMITNKIDGEARETGKYIVERSCNCKYSQKNIAFISSGETTVTLKGKGKGGRNQELILGSMKSLADKDIVFASFATDGIDGNSDAAGAIADKYSLARANEKNLEIDKILEDNNSYEFFKKLEDLLITGTTGINLMDVQILLKT
jgi:hydroxypyruvate reductase/glycerate 2-kinase